MDDIPDFYLRKYLLQKKFARTDFGVLDIPEDLMKGECLDFLLDVSPFEAAVHFFRMAGGIEVFQDRGVLRSRDEYSASPEINQLINDRRFDYLCWVHNHSNGIPIPSPEDTHYISHEVMGIFGINNGAGTLCFYCPPFLGLTVYRGDSEEGTLMKYDGNLISYEMKDRISGSDFREFMTPEQRESYLNEIPSNVH